jgi:hypothetical protein
MSDDADLRIINKYRLAELEEASRELNYLHSYGVVNWEGYEAAIEEMNNDN